MRHLAAPRRRVFCFVALAGVAVAACGGSSGTSSPATYTNPVLHQDFADPGILDDNGTYYVYATNSGINNIPVARSKNLVTWDVLGDALPALPNWALPTFGDTWAPQVIKIGSRYVMYYVARDIRSNKQCVGVATSSKPEGPFIDSESQALVCQATLGGSIDPYPLQVGNHLYLYYKNDGNCCGLPTHIWGQRLSADGLSLTGSPTDLIVNDQAWEGSVVEAPDMEEHDGKFYLFFSGNNYANASYAVGYATCQSPLGPCQQSSDNPILASKPTSIPPVVGPGGENLFQVDNQTWMIYHAWHMRADGSQGTSRYLYMDRVDWQNGKPVVHGPTTTPQPAPLANH